jgi:uncharacterized membrane protein YjjP (DUF1212 family)
MSKKLESPSTPVKSAVPEVKPRCAWSGETSKNLKSLSDVGLTAKGQEIHLYALPDYEVKVRNFIGYYQRFRQLFQGLIAAGIAGIFLAMFGGMVWLEPYAWLFVGIILMIFPFAHSQTFQGMTLRNSTRLARGVAVGCVVMAIFLFFS